MSYIYSHVLNCFCRLPRLTTYAKVFMPIDISTLTRFDLVEVQYFKDDHDRIVIRNRLICAKCSAKNLIYQ